MHTYEQPLLRWAGSKRSLIPTLAANIPAEFGRYVEPFAGSACLFFAVGPERALLSDANSRLIEMYSAIRARPARVAAVLEALPRPDVGYYDVRSADPHLSDRFAKAASFVYLNRSCFNGVYRTNRAGHFNVPRGTRIGPLPGGGDLRRVARALRGARLRDWDFRRTLREVTTDDFVYLDPPFSRSKAPHYGLYGYGGFGSADVDDLAAALLEIDRRGATFLLSFGGPGVEALTNGWHVQDIAIRRQVAASAAKRVSDSEVLISNRPLQSRTG